MESWIDRLHLRDSVRLTGPLYGQAKRDAFATADAFVLPSYSEGSPMVVLDSLAAGVPVIATKGTPWKDLLTCRCGWWVDASAEGLTDAIRGMLDQTPERLKEMGQNGRELVRAQYLWPIQARKTIHLYEWLLGRKDKPGFVVNT